MRPDAAKVEGGPGDGRRHGPGPRGGRADLRAASGGEAEEAREADAREQVGGRHADIGGGDGQLTLGGAHVGAAAQQLGGIADGQRLGNHRQRLGREVHGKLFRPLAEEGGDAVAGARLFGLQLGQAGFGGGQAAIGAQHVELAADAGIAQLLGEATGFTLVLQVFAGNAFTQLGAAQVAVGVHQFGDQADLQLLQVGLGDAYLGIAGLYLALDAAEQVELPGHVQAEVIAF
ncbi:hypothetical protein D3C84_348920 [compost metagenome]